MATRPPALRLAILENLSLKPYTTFRIGGPARYFAAVETREDLAQAIEFARSRSLAVFILGGGSNVLVSDAGLNAFVIHPAREGAGIVQEDSENVWVQAEAAEEWDGLVALAARNNWWGIENLSHIPGQTGAALVQNVGAYGQQISDVFEHAEVAKLSTGDTEFLTNEDCNFGYRRSVFNTTRKGAGLIWSITLRLRKEACLNLTYPDVRRWFERAANLNPSIQQIRDAIITIRDSKFPFPREEKGGNAGSFFKNAVLTAREYAALEQRFRKSFGPAELARLKEFKFHSGDGIKIPTAFLIQVCGLKGKRMGNVEVNEAQPLVLLNRGGAAAHEVMLLARQVRQTIFSKTGIEISIEPELVGFSANERQEYLALE
jgi:UDP-N-acetylmuramate dehydrogenase